MPESKIMALAEQNERMLSLARRDFLKCLAIGTGGIALASFFVDIEETLAQSLQDNLGKIPMEERWALAAEGLVYSILASRIKMKETLGQEKLNEIIRQAGMANGRYGKMIADRFGLRGTDAQSAALIIPVIPTVYYGPTQQYEFGELSSERAEVRCLECAFWNAQKEMKVAGDFCSQGTAGYWEGFSKAINPNLTATVIKAKPLKDPYCAWIIEQKV